MENFVQVRGDQFVKNGEELFFCGIGLGSWLNMEHFMLGMPGTDYQIRQTFEDVCGKECAGEFFDSFVYHFIGEEDFRFLKSLKINLVRVPFNYRLFLDDQDPSGFREKGFEYFDYLFRLANKYEIYVLLDLHAVPGGQNPDWHSDNGTGCTQFWQFGVFRRQIVDLWREIAARYRGEPWLLGYDILNEPFIIPDQLDSKDEEDMATGFVAAHQDDMLSEYYRSVTKAVREADPSHIIFLEGDHFASSFDCIHDIEDEQTALTFHYYPTVWYADLYDKDYDEIERKKKFEEVFVRLIAIREEFGRPILCGEAGYEISRNGFEDTMPLIEITLELFRKYQVSFTLWSYKDAQFMGMVYPRTDSLWMKFVNVVQKSWNHHMELDSAREEIDDFCDKFFPQATKNERYILCFRQRAILYPLQQKYILKPLLEKLSREEIAELPSSFDFQNCEYYEQFADLYRRIF